MPNTINNCYNAKLFINNKPEHNYVRLIEELTQGVGNLSPYLAHWIVDLWVCHLSLRFALGISPL